MKRARSRLTGCGFFGNWLDTSQGHSNAVLLDIVCERYGIPPHEYLRKHIGMLSLDAKIALIGMKHQRKVMEDRAEEAKAEQKLLAMTRRK